MARDNRMIGFVIAGLLVAGLGAVPSALSAAHGFDRAAWGLSVTANGLVVASLLFCSRKSNIPSAPWWSWWTTALTWLTLAPQADSSVMHTMLAHLGLAVTGSGIGFAQCSPKSGRLVLSGVAAFVASFLVPTAVVWPIGFAWGAGSWTGRTAWILCGLAGVVAGRAAGWPILLGYPYHGAATGLHADLLTLLPIVMLGSVGWLASTSIGPGRSQIAMDPRMLGWAAAGMAVVILAMLGVAVDVRLGVLPFCWLVPRGLAELVDALAGRRSPSPLPRRIGAIAAVVLIVLVVPPASKLLDGALLLYDLCGSRLL